MPSGKKDAVQYCCQTRRRPADVSRGGALGGGGGGFRCGCRPTKRIRRKRQGKINKGGHRGDATVDNREAGNRYRRASGRRHEMATMQKSRLKQKEEDQRRKREMKDATSASGARAETETEQGGEGQKTVWQTDRGVKASVCERGGQSRSRARGEIDARLTMPMRRERLD